MAKGSHKNKKMAEAPFSFDSLVFHPYDSIQSEDGKSGDRAGTTGDLGLAFVGCWIPRNGGDRSLGTSSNWSFLLPGLRIGSDFYL